MSLHNISDEYSYSYIGIYIYIYTKCALIVRTEAAASLACDNGNYAFCDTP